ncbi:hypothetical protein OBJ92_07110 [Empedobacter falsenii]
MKSYLYKIIICLILSNFKTFGQVPINYFGKYGFEKKESITDYQSYIGQTVVYLPKKNIDNIDKSFNGAFNKSYTITKISGNDKKIILQLKEVDGNSIVKMNVFILNDKESSLYKPFYISEKETIPLFFINKFNEDKSKYIGNIISNNKVKSNNEIIDCIIDYKKSNTFLDLNDYPKILYTLKNSVTGIEFNVNMNDAEVEASNHDLSGNYVSTLIKVEKPTDEKFRYGKTAVTNVEGVNKYSYIDNFIDIIILGTYKDFKINLKNVSDNTIKIVWDEAVIVDLSGNTSKVMHNGVKYSQRNESQVSTVVIKDSSIEDVIIPTSNVYYTDYKYIDNEWSVNPMYPYFRNNTPENLGEIKLMLPIQVKEVVNEYIFVFKVEWLYKYPEIIL